MEQKNKQIRATYMTIKFSDKVIIIIQASVAVAWSNMPWFYVWYSNGRLNMHPGLWFTKDTPFLAVTGEPMDVFCEDLGEKLAALQRYHTESVYIDLHTYIFIYMNRMDTIYTHKSKIFCNVTAVVFGDLLMAITKCHLVKAYTVRNMEQYRTSQWLIVHWHTAIPWTKIAPAAGPQQLLRSVAFTQWHLTCNVKLVMAKISLSLAPLILPSNLRGSWLL